MKQEQAFNGIKLLLHSLIIIPPQASQSRMVLLTFSRHNNKAIVFAQNTIAFISNILQRDDFLTSKHTKSVIICCGVFIVLFGFFFYICNFPIPKINPPSNGIYSPPITLITPPYITWRYYFAAPFCFFLGMAVIATVSKFRSKLLTCLTVFAALSGICFAFWFIREIKTIVFIQFPLGSQPQISLPTLQRLSIQYFPH